MNDDALFHRQTLLTDSSPISRFDLARSVPGTAYFAGGANGATWALAIRFYRNTQEQLLRKKDAERAMASLLARVFAEQQR